MSIVQDSASKLVSLLNVPHSATSLPEPCRTYGLQLICGTWLRPCLTVNNGKGFLTPSDFYAGLLFTFVPYPVSLPIPEELCLDTSCNFIRFFPLPTLPLFQMTRVLGLWRSWGLLWVTSTPCLRDLV